MTRHTGPSSRERTGYAFELLLHRVLISARTQQGLLRPEPVSSKYVDDKKEAVNGKLNSRAKLASSNAYQIMGI